jgi:hypothetical protein
VNLSPYSLTAESGYRMGGAHYIFRLRKALADYGSLSKAPRPKVEIDPQTTAKPAPKAAMPVAKK